jgi:polypeptide N-acetylgalactosaminyltransferase
MEPGEEEVSDAPGEGGKAYNLPADKKNVAEESLSNYGMNMAVSDVISLERTIPDTRMDE